MLAELHQLSRIAVLPSQRGTVRLCRQVQHAVEQRQWHTLESKHIRLLCTCSFSKHLSWQSWIADTEMKVCRDNRDMRDTFASCAVRQ